MKFRCLFCCLILNSVFLSHIRFFFECWNLLILCLITTVVPVILHNSMHISIKATLESNEWAAETHDGINMHWLSWGKVNRFVPVIRFSFK